MTTAVSRNIMATSGGDAKLFARVCTIMHLILSNFLYSSFPEFEYFGVVQSPYKLQCYSLNLKPKCFSYTKLPY